MLAAALVPSACSNVYGLPPRDLADVAVDDGVEDTAFDLGPSDGTAGGPRLDSGRVADDADASDAGRGDGAAD